MPTLTLFCGLPGSGKTTLAKELERSGRGVRICTDDWQADLEIAHANETFHHKLQNRLYLLALDLLAKNVDVILEDGLWTRSERISKLADARRLNTRVELHFFDLTFEDLWLRLRDRNETALANSASITRQALTSYWRVFQRPDRMELDLFDHTTVHT